MYHRVIKKRVAARREATKAAVTEALTRSKKYDYTAHDLALALEAAFERHNLQICWKPGKAPK